MVMCRWSIFAIILHRAHVTYQSYRNVIKSNWRIQLEDEHMLNGKFCLNMQIFPTKKRENVFYLYHLLCKYHKLCVMWALRHDESVIVIKKEPFVIRMWEFSHYAFFKWSLSKGSHCKEHFDFFFVHSEYKSEGVIFVDIHELVVMEEIV